jgi:hypothetical protein
MPDFDIEKMFDLEKTVEKRFGSFDETLAFVSEEKKRIVRIPISGLWKEGARFYEDGKFGKGSKFFKFNAYGFQAICNMTGVSEQTLTRLQTPGFASTVLNDLMGGVLSANRTAKSAEIILDEDKGAVIGVVSEKYVGYSNDAFLRDVLICLDEDNNGALFPSTSDFAFKVAYSINSRLFLRLVSKSVKGVVFGPGGTGKDVSEIGVELSNSMAGGHAVRLSWFVFRLICANGLVAQVAGSEGRIVHLGAEESFRERLYASGKGLFASLGRTKRMIENLASIQFDPVGLAKHADLKTLFSIIPDRDLKKEALGRTNGKAYGAPLKRDGEIARMADAIAALPFCLGGHEALRVFRSRLRDNASMYDFVNIFTEHAKHLPDRQKIDVETKAGSLASWIVENKRKFA